MRFRYIYSCVHTYILYIYPISWILSQYTYIHTYIHTFAYLKAFMASSRLFLANSCPFWPSIIRFRSFTAFFRRLTLLIALFHSRHSTIHTLQYINALHINVQIYYTNTYIHTYIHIYIHAYNILIKNIYATFVNCMYVCVCVSAKIFGIIVWNLTRLPLSSSPLSIDVLQPIFYAFQISINDILCVMYTLMSEGPIGFWFD